MGHLVVDLTTCQEQGDIPVTEDAEIVGAMTKCEFLANQSVDHVPQLARQTQER